MGARVIRSQIQTRQMGATVLTDHPAPFGEIGGKLGEDCGRP